MKRNCFIMFTTVILLFSLRVFAQLDSVYYLSQSGVVPSGAMQTTDNFTNEPIPIGEPRVIPHIITNSEPMINTGGESETLLPYVYVEDLNASANPQGSNEQTVLLEKFPGIPMTNSIPPDPTMAVGPNHIIVCANSLFRIYDKQGNLLKNIGAGGWWAPITPFEGGDPQVIYDHFMGRWVLMWLEGSDNPPQYGDLVAYSDDSDPLGIWYLYRFPNSSLGDFPKLGYDDEALYISWRNGATSIRIIDKDELYSSNGGPVSFVRLYNIRTPGGGSSSPVRDDIIPSISYTSGSGAWFLWALGSFGPTPIPSTEYVLYKVTNPLTNPGLKGKVLNVPTYFTPPLGGQLGGGMGLETNGWMARQPVVRDGYLYAAHDVANSNSHAYSSVKYIKVDLTTTTPSIVENVEFGNLGYYYMYPALTVDKDHNIAVTFSRSATTEYIGGYYSTKLAADPPGLSPSQPLVEGQGHYVVDFSSGRNRWGDYLGIYLDPSDENNVWIFPEYAAATDQWGTMVGEIRMVPFTGVYTYLSNDSVAFGDVEINTISDTLEVVVANYGTDDLVISAVSSEVGPFTRISEPTFPYTLQTYDSLTIKVFFSPTEANDYDEVLSVSSNDPEFTGIKLTGHSYEMNVPFTGLFYASTGAGNNGDIITIDKETGVGTTIGTSLFSEVRSLAVNPSNNILYGLVFSGNTSEIIRVNASMGDSYTLFTLDIPLLSGIDFDASSTMYASSQNGNIYTIDLSIGSYTLAVTATIPLNAIAINPTTNQFWGAMYRTFGLGKDSLFTIDLTTGIATPIGKTGYSVMTNDMAFDGDGKLYGVTGASNQEGKLFEINQTDGSGTVIGTGVGYNHTLGLAYSLNGPPIVSVDDDENSIPNEYAFNQNYPNPFNPTTKIEFSLPVEAKVQLIIYNILGQQVASLIDDQLSAGNYSVVWNSDNSNRNKLSSGIYLYKLKATGIDGSEFQQIRKMVLLK